MVSMKGKLGLLAGMSALLTMNHDMESRGGLSGVGNGSSWVKTNMTPKMLKARRRAKAAKIARKKQRQP